MKFLNILSYLNGGLAKIYIPNFLRGPFFRAFSSLYSVNLLEMKKEICEYSNFIEFFTRDLKDGSRMVKAGAVLVSPADSKLIDAGRISGDITLGIKGADYRVSELLGSENEAREFKGGSFFNFYLAPGDYHHVHSPVSGRIISRRYIPGSLFPVSSFFVKAIPNLYGRQERIVTILEAESGMKLALVMVGAFNVGSMRLEFDKEPITNRPFANCSDSSRVYPEPIETKVGERFGTFRLGSTVVLLCSEYIGGEDRIGEKFKYGESILRI